MNIFSCRFFVSLVWYLTHDDVAVCRGGGGDFSRRFCQLPPPPSYPCHDSVEEWRRVFQIQDPWYLLQRSLKIFNCIVSIIYIHVHQYHKWHVDNTNNHHANIYMLYMFYLSILIVMLRWNVCLHIMQQKISSVYMNEL